MKARIWHDCYDSGIPTTLEYPPYPVDYFLQQSADKSPNSTALIFGGIAPLLGEQHSTMTYRELNDTAIAYYGVLRAGGVVVPSNPLYVAREIEHQLKDSGATIAGKILRRKLIKDGVDSGCGPDRLSKKPRLRETERMNAQNKLETLVSQPDQIDD